MDQERLRHLPEEKKVQIMNAAFEVFGNNEYKRASTDLIAARAGISKGLLFYYFKSKKELYLYLLSYAIEEFRPQILDEKFYAITDFFELLAYTTRKKAELLHKFPYIMEFSVRAFYSCKEDVSQEMNSMMNDQIERMFTEYFKNIDLSKFKEDADPNRILHMLIWMADGYMHQKMFACMGRDTTGVIEVEDLMEQFAQWSEMFKKIAYKEEYQGETDL
ncbi:TetR/AcrR family transcriptional regulator [Lactonifactor longoviformis]|uniref:TetR/AcrR family transcriptional regulator n=1 Tax=Lactonifactor longoviformis TaxID=341220 RepID=UPI00210B6DDB|nr:TetR/AcrR family transcriptional regulator [Lactonifactor longoviformis]MCQ4671989.1 TetR/AcrR family transcriptional regulator [Lactonifactor longoviformis]